MRLAQMTNRISPTSVPAKARLTLVSRTNEMDGDAGVRNELLGNCSASTAKIDRDQRLAGELLLGAQPEAALLGDLDVVVEEADEPQPGHEEQHEHAAHRQRGEREQVRRDVGREGRADDDGAAHGRACRAWCGARSVRRRG